MLVRQDWGPQKGYVSIRIKSEHDIKNWTFVKVDMFPDLEDWATCGILLGMLTRAAGNRSFGMTFNDPNLPYNSWVLNGDQAEPFEVWDSFGGIVAASLLFLWDQKEPDLWS